MVVLFHARVPFVRGGFAGVDVFFVLSGFLISGILFAEVKATGRISLIRFWARRARRLLPAATVTAVCTLAMVVALASPFAATDYVKTAAAFAVYVSNLLFVRRQSDYFATNTVPDPLLHTWTLAIEEQFYLVFAPLLWITALAVGRRSFATFLRRAIMVCAAIAAAAFLANILIGVRYPLLAFYTLPFRAWEFGIGAVAAAYLAARPDGDTTHPGLAWLALAGIAGLLLTAFVIPERASSHGVALLLPTVATALIILGGRDRRPHLANTILGSPPLRYLGRVSYAWYLWHWPVLIALALSFPHASLGARLAACGASLALSALSYRSVEEPIRHSRSLARRPRLTLAAAGVSMAVVIAASALANAVEHRRLESPNIRNIVQAQTAPFMPPGTHCHLKPEEIVPGACAFGDTKSSTTIVLFGDSHAEHWFPALERAAAERHWRLVSYTKSGCPSVEVDVTRAASIAYPECTRWRQLILERLTRERPVLVLVSNAHAYTLRLKAGAIASMFDNPTARQAWQDGLATLLGELRGIGTKTLVIGDPPTPGFDVPICLSTPARNEASCGFSLNDARRDSVTALEAPVVSRFADARYFDTIALVCDHNYCPARRGQLIVWRDDNHMSPIYARSLAPHMAGAVAAVLGN